MFKKLALAAASLGLTAKAALAGGLTAVTTEPAVIEVMPTEPSSMSAWLVPLIILVLVALAYQNQA